MLKILINAYACCPGKGSEPGMGWNFIHRLAKVAEVFVITESEFETENRAMESGNLHFFFVPAGETEEESRKVRSMCWNQGKWSFYFKYRHWQEKALATAERIIGQEENSTGGHGIDIMHQLNLTGFREPGMLYRINDKRIKNGQKAIPLVWGPVTGYGKIPFAFMVPGGIKFTSFYLLKNFLNLLQISAHPRVIRMIRSSDRLIAATPETAAAIERFHRVETEFMNETGVLSESLMNLSQTKDYSGFKIIWVGRFIYTKQLELALRTIKNLVDLDGLEFHVVGKGYTDKETRYYHNLAQELGIEDIVKWHGFVSNDEVMRLMSDSDLFFFTSIFEATSTVILEAIQNKLPVLCFDRCGFGPVIDGQIGIKIKCVNPSDAVKSFSEKIRYLYNNRSVLEVMSMNCSKKQHELGWDRKIDRLLNIYNELVTDDADKRTETVMQ